MTTQAQTGLLSFLDARRAAENEARKVKPGAPDHCALLDARGRVLAETVSADRDLPPFPRATRDGFAVRATDVAKLPAKLRVVAQLKAGSAWTRTSPLAASEAAEIMTGAAAP